MVVLLHGQADRQIVDDGNHFTQMLREQPVKQHFVAIVQSGQIDVLAQRIRQPLVLDVGPPDLCAQRADVRRQQAAEPQGSAFVRAEGSTFVQ